MYVEHIKGLKSEKIVLQFLIKNGWSLTSQRLKTPYAEIDLLVCKDDLYKVVEVKSINNEEFLEYRLNYKQKARLKKAIEYLIRELDKVVFFELAIVNSQGQIELIEIEF